MSKNLSGRYGYKRLDLVKQSATDVLKTSSKIVVKKTVERAGDLIGNNIAYKITTVSKSSRKNNSETTTNKHDKELLIIYRQKKTKLSII